MKPTQEPSPEESIFRFSSARKLMILALFGGVIFLIVYFFFLNDEPSESAAGTPNAIETTEEPQFEKEGELAFIDAETQDTLQHIDIEVAEDRAAQAQGLMYRSAMEENHGMLFPYPSARPLSFYMKNMKMSIDIIFADAERKIVTIHQAAMPYSEKSLPSSEDAQYVVEVTAGFTSRHNIEEGDFITYETID